VSFAKGFLAAGVSAGIKASEKLDVALVVNEGPEFTAAAVFTSNRCKANPVLWSIEAIKDRQARAVLLNSGGANCYTGPVGFQTTHSSAELTASLLDCSAQDVIVCSTGIIGEQLDREKLLQGIKLAHAQLSVESGPDAARAIMTTDTIPKQAERSSKSGWRIGGMAKGAGMLAPALATMLVVITTDASVPGEQLDKSLRRAVRVSFDRLDSDGATSTNDQVTILASGASGIVADQAEFESLLTELCLDLAQQLMRDAEGASHNIYIEVQEAASEEDAVAVARAVARNNLFKAAIFGNDPNWGRILAAVGTTDAAFDPYNIDVSINGVLVSSSGAPAQDRSKVNLAARDVLIEINLHAGDKNATVLTNDLTVAYVEENSAYSS
jgi:glutamate N-acetyltransferase / amino-acid N-acetyltransferase